MYNKMINAFKNAEGGLFSKVEKADVGDVYAKLVKQGVRLMGWADPFMPDSSLSSNVLEATSKALSSPSAPHYTAPIGNAELKKAIAEKLLKNNNLNVDADRNILVTPGSDSGLFYSMLPFINDGDEVIVPMPSYPNNIKNVEILNGKVIPYLLQEENGFQIEKNKLENLISKKTKLLVLTHPNNPTTTVYNSESLNAICELVVEHDLILICDQAFEDFTFENEMITPAAMENMFDRTISVFSFSKGMGLSGFRVGYVVASDWIIDKLYANAVYVIGATNTAFQIGCIEALRYNPIMNEFEEKFDLRRKMAFDIVNSIPNVHMAMPESGFLCWINVSKLGTGSEIADYLLSEAKVAVNAGINYGLNGQGYIRIVLGVYRDNQVVKQALLDIKSALIKFQEHGNV